MTSENLKKASEFKNEIIKLEKEIDFLISRPNKWYSLFKFKTYFLMKTKQDNEEIKLYDEEIAWIINNRAIKIMELKDKIEEL